VAKSREKVQQQGFWDQEVATPNHDAVLLWCHKQADLIARSVRPQDFNRAWRPEDVDHAGHWVSDRQAIADSAQRFVGENARPDPEVERRDIEHVLRTYSGHGNKIERVVGFADLVIHVRTPRVEVIFDESTSGFSGHRLGWNREGLRILVEAKSVLPTVGELMRQMQLYRTAFGGPMVVVAPDDSYADILRDQRIHFIRYQAGSESVSTR